MPSGGAEVAGGGEVKQLTGPVGLGDPVAKGAQSVAGLSDTAASAVGTTNLRGCGKRKADWNEAVPDVKAAVIGPVKRAVGKVAKALKPGI